MTPDGLRDRVTSVCVTLGLTQAQTPFSFELQPTGVIDQVFRVESDAGQVIGGFNFSEERTDLLTIWVARKYAGLPEATYRRAQQDISSIRAAVVRDGAVTSGEYSVPDAGYEAELQREIGKEYAVLRMVLPCNYEATL